MVTIRITLENIMLRITARHRKINIAWSHVCVDSEKVELIGLERMVAA